MALYKETRTDRFGKPLSDWQRAKLMEYHLINEQITMIAVYGRWSPEHIRVFNDWCTIDHHMQANRIPPIDHIHIELIGDLVIWELDRLLN